jgi:hypothetical protein
MPQQLVLKPPRGGFSLTAKSGPDVSVWHFSDMPNTLQNVRSFFSPVGPSF